jgi:stage II sporulation protein R
MKDNNKINPEVPTLVENRDYYIRPAHREAFPTSIHKTKKHLGFHYRLFLLILLFSGLSMCLINVSARADTSLQEGIAQKVLRFHVIANSDSEEDQQLKLKVKEALVDSLTPQLEEVKDLAMVRSIVTNHMEDIQKTAETIIRQQGFSYSVTVTLEKCYFPLKVYGDYTFPPGYYEALRVRIGMAQGKNWWCVMFPPLCFVDGTYSIVDENSKEKLLSLLTDEEYGELVSGKAPVKIKFKLFEIIKDLIE